MIRWSFWIDSWEHPFNTWNLNTSVKAFVEASPIMRDYLPPPKPPPTPPAAFDPKPKKKTGPTTSWDWSKFRMPFFEHGFTRDRVPQSPGFDYYLSDDDSYYSPAQLRLRKWLHDRPWLGTGAPPVVRVGLYTLDRMTYARGSGDLYSEDIATYEDSALVGGGGMVI